MSGLFDLSKSDTLRILVGQMGGSCLSTECDGQVFKITEQNLQATHLFLKSRSF